MFAIFEKQDKNYHIAMKIKKRVAVALWRLSTRNSSYSTAAVYDIEKSSAFQIMREFCKYIAKKTGKFIKSQNRERETAVDLEKFFRI